MTKGMVIWTAKAERCFRRKWPQLECTRVAGDEATYIGERLTQQDLKRPGSVAHEWLERGLIEWVDSVPCQRAKIKRDIKQMKPWMDGYDDYLQDRWETLQYWLARDDIKSISQAAVKMGFHHSGSLNYFIVSHGDELARKYGKLPHGRWENNKSLSDIWKKLVED